MLSFGVIYKVILARDAAIYNLPIHYSTAKIQHLYHIRNGRLPQSNRGAVNQHLYMGGTSVSQSIEIIATL